MNKLSYYLRNILKQIRLISEKIILPGFNGQSLYSISKFFFKGITAGAISIRAASVAYNLFFSIFPALIFLIGLIAFIPIDNFQYELLKLLETVLPENAYSLFNTTICDTITNQRTSALSVGFLLSLFFASNGVLALIAAFSKSYYSVKRRSWINERLISILLVLILAFLLIIAILLIVMGGYFFDLIIKSYPSIDTTFIRISYIILKWIIVISLYFLAISFLYHLAHSKKEKYRFISPGAIFATVIQIIAILGFSYYIKNFATYNKLYGSIGTIMVVMLLFYITALVMILGYELNISANIVKKNKNG